MSRKLIQCDQVEGSFSINDSNWDLALAEGTAAFLTSAGAARHGVAGLEAGVCALHGRLARFREFHDALEVVRAAQPSAVEPWIWHPLFETEAIRVGLLVVYRFGRIPLHDHPGAFGAQLVLSGRLRIKQFEQQASSGSSGGLKVLELSIDRELWEGETASYKPDAGNIHELEATQPSAVLFTATTPPYCDKERAWYYPVPLCPQERSRFLVNRVTRRTSVARLWVEKLAGRKAVSVLE